MEQTSDGVYSTYCAEGELIGSLFHDLKWLSNWKQLKQPPSEISTSVLLISACHFVKVTVSKRG